MANTFSPFGLREFGEREGQAPTMGFDTVILNTSDTNTYFTGDLVALSSVGVLTLASSGSTPASPYLGVFMGCEYYNPTTLRNEWHPYFPGAVGSSAPGKAFVCTDPERWWIIQGSTTGVLGSSVIGWNAGVTSSEAFARQALGNTITGISNVALNSTSVSATATLPLRIVATYQSYAPPGGFVNGTSSGAEAGQILVVQGNNWARNTTTGVST